MEKYYLLLHVRGAGIYRVYTEYQTSEVTTLVTKLEPNRGKKTNKNSKSQIDRKFLYSE